MVNLDTAAQAPSAAKAWDSIGRVIRKLVFIPVYAKQGRHDDPVDVSPDQSGWTAERRAVQDGPEMEIYRQALCIDGKSVRESVLDDLSRFYNLPVEACIERALDWEAWSVREWNAADRTTPAGLQDFYDTTQSWSFDLLWYCYMQSLGYGYPATAFAAKFIRERLPEGGAHIDFGSGVGATAQTFARMGFTTTLADVSRPLRTFAQWRLERRGDKASYIDLSNEKLKPGSYDVMTAVDTLVHVPDFAATVREIHASLRSGGWLLTNFDVREKGSDETAWHLYSNALRLEHDLLKTGFYLRDMIGGETLCFQKADPATAEHRRYVAARALTLPLREMRAASRRVRWPTPRRVGKAVKRLLKLG